MLDQLKSGCKVAGAKQTKRAVNDGRAKVVFLADDADPRITEAMETLCAKKGVPVERGCTMKQLGDLCGIAVGSAVAALLV